MNTIIVILLIIFLISLSVAAGMYMEYIPVPSFLQSNTTTTTTSTGTTTSTPTGTTTSGGGAVAPSSPTVTVAAPVNKSYTMTKDTSCYSPSSDLGFLGKISTDDAKNKCNDTVDCRAFTQHEAGDVWLLKNADTKNNRPGASCWSK